MKKGIVALVAGMIGAAVGTVITNKIEDEKKKNNEAMIHQYTSYFTLFNQWLIIKQEGMSIEQYFMNNNIKEIAIYGMGVVGNRLYDELKDTTVDIKYGIDRNAQNIYSDIRVLHLDAELEKVDAIIVTPTFAFDEIQESLSNVTDYPIISLEDILFDM